jgi:hypothetical protein
MLIKPPQAVMSSNLLQSIRSPILEHVHPAAIVSDACMHAMPKEHDILLLAHMCRKPISI